MLLVLMHSVLATFDQMTTWLFLKQVIPSVFLKKLTIPGIFSFIYDFSKNST